MLGTSLLQALRALRRAFRLRLVILGATLLGFLSLGLSSAGFARDFRIQILSDIHYPAKTLLASEREKARVKKDRALMHLAQESGIDLVVFLGDTVALNGTEASMREAAQFVSRLPQKKLVLAGNHELMYCPQLGLEGKLVRAAPALVLENQDRFKRLFKTTLNGAFSVAGYRLIYLAGDDETAATTVQIKASTLRWFDRELSEHAQAPTIIFCHAPLPGTLPGNEKPKNFANPPEALQAILERHKNVLAWVSGHTHTKVKAPGFHHPSNLYLGRILNIHCPSWERNHLYANSLFLGKDRVTIRTYDFETNAWIDALERHIPISTTHPRTKHGSTSH